MQNDHIQSQLENGNILSILNTEDLYLSINNLRTFHNQIKQALYFKYTKNKQLSLLDLACGKGGDIQKYLKCQYKFILAIDNNIKSIKARYNIDGYDGAIARWNSIKSNMNFKPYIRFEILDLLDSNLTLKINQIDNYKKYDLISCQFALHYFSETEHTLFNFFRTISNKLKKNGVFFGTTTNGDIISNILQKGNIDLPFLKLLSNSDKINQYLFYINETNPNDTRKNYFQLEGISTEYLIFKNKLLEIIQHPQINLELIEFINFNEWYKFPPIISNLQKYNNYPLSRNEMIISFLNFSFAFRKK